MAAKKATKRTTERTNWNLVECDDCGWYEFADRAKRVDYTCPAPRTAYICSRCTSGETPIEITSSINIPSMPNRGWERY